ncbi:hypothetical protein ABZV58_03545 [Nocardia sp. NPDC004654]|uniref:hypothetical protein n=1 Tax=Nocardia sp. NPDC004654 TaxID=3154776 RepID=UPI0033BB92A9
MASVISLPERAPVSVACSRGLSVRARVWALVWVVLSVAYWTVSVISPPERVLVWVVRSTGAWVRVLVWVVRSTRASALALGWARVSRVPSTLVWKARSVRAPVSAARWKARSDPSRRRARTCLRASAAL